MDSDSCSVLITGSRLLSFSGSFGRKKKESHSQPPSPLSARPYQNGRGGFANSNSPKVHHSVAPSVSVKKKIVSESNKSLTSSSSGDPDDFFNHKPEKKPSQTIPLSSNNLVFHPLLSSMISITTYL